MEDEKRPVGRPPIPIDPGRLEGMVSYGATCLECAEQFNCSDDAIVAFIKRTYGMNFAEFAYKKQGNIRLRLRQKQIDLALKGSIPMLIWMGKQMLGQSDEVKLQHDLEGLQRFERPTVRIEVQNADGKTIQELEHEWSDQAKLPWIPEEHKPLPNGNAAPPVEDDLDELLEADS